MIAWRRAVALLLFVVTMSACAAGPRWVAGAKWSANSQPMRWYRPDVQYFVDQGPLSQYVDHAAAVALVDAAASVWTVPGVSFSLSDGGALGEDVSGDSVYPGTNGVQWPADVQSGNYTAKQIAVVLDADGAITDLLLGSGASAPANCRTAAVTESVDLFIQPGRIAHAIVIVNGRCTGPAPEQQLQLQYQLMRTFGRVIGLGWSQLNDNVFTGIPAPTYQDQLHWPIMHPIDVLCGPYSYQCLAQPFTLREDDVASLMLLNTDQLNASNPGRVTTVGWVRFPDGEGMNGVNMVARRNYPNDNYGTESFGIVSNVSGFLAPGDLGNPVTGGPADADDKQGGTAGFAPGYFVLFGVPSLPQFSFISLSVTSEPINPLYHGAYAVGPYHMAAVAPSGDSIDYLSFGNRPGMVSGGGSFVPAHAVYQCGSGSDGTENAPAPLSAEGVWSGRLCSVGHTSWMQFHVRAGRTATIETTAVDEAGASTTGKAMPVLGLWHGGTATGTSPTAGVAAAFNAAQLGKTQLRASFTAAEPVRLAIADARGDGRPDYVYRARVLYADTISPVRLGPAGGAIRILGTGFQAGATVTVGGVLATITSLSATEIEAVAPTLDALHGVSVNDVVVTDSRTGGSTAILRGLTYNGATNDVLTLVTTPPATLAVGASAPFAVRLLDANGSPAPNAAIAVSAAGSAATLSACGLPSCTLLTDASGLVQTRVIPQAPGAITLQATASSGSNVSATFTSVQSAQSITFLRATQYIAAGVGASFHPAVMLTGSGANEAARSVQWTTLSARVALGAASANGSVSQVQAIGSLRDGESASVQACAWGNVCATESLVGVPATDLQVVLVSGGGQSVTASGTLQPLMVRVTDSAGHPVAGATAGIYQEASGWQPPCATPGRCAVAPVYGSTHVFAVSDDDGLITVEPLQYDATAALTHVTVSAGTIGVLSVALQKTP